MPARRAVLRVVICLCLHALARELDAAVGILLRSSLDLPDLVTRALRLLGGHDLLRAAGAWTAAGVTTWLGLSALLARASRVPLADALVRTSHGFQALLLRPALSLLALLSLAHTPTFPYGSTLVVGLTQDWGAAQDAAALATLLACALPRLALPAPGAGAVFFIALVGYANLCPPWARTWEGHPGNEPKTLRMALAIGHHLSLDTEPISAPMEQLTPQPLWQSLPRAVGGLAGESAQLITTLASGGPRALGASAIAATRVSRQTIRGKQGGIYHVLAPGPSALLAPLLRLDRALNLARDTPGRISVTLLVWQGLAALLVACVFTLARAASGRPGIAAAVSLSFAFAPPFVFYSFQFYPEMLGALWIALGLRLVLFGRVGGARGLFGLGLLLGSLPWLHQKFLPVWGLLTLMALVRAVHELVPWRALLALLVPQAVSAALFLLYNFAITGSARPDALFLAWGPGGVSSARLGQGLLGLWLDARYGLVPYAPAYLLAVAGLWYAGRLRWALPAIGVYYLTVAAADNWSGAVCNLGRYLMPLTPFLLALVTLALARATRAGVALALTLFAWTALLSHALWLDPHAANDCALLLAKAVFADGTQYLPGLFIRSWSQAAPGTFARVGFWVVVAVVLTLWWRRQRGSPLQVLAALTLFSLGSASLLETWPSRYRTLRLHDALEVQAGTIVFFEGAEVDNRRVRAGAGTVELLVRSRTPLTTLVWRASGTGTLRTPGNSPLPLSPGGGAVAIPLQPVAELEGRLGVHETLYRQRLEIQSAGEVWFTLP